MKKLLTCIVVLLMAVNSYGQGSRTITARVMDAETKKGVYNAQIIVFNTNKIAYTNFLGYFELTLKEQDEKILVSHVRYQTTEVYVPDASGFQIRLTPKPAVLPTLSLSDYYKGGNSKTTIEMPGKFTELDSSNTFASYKGGWNLFYNTLGNLVKNDPEFQNGETGGNVSFDISKEGQLINVNYDSVLNRNVIINAMSKLTNWKVARQNGMAIEQHFELPLSYTKVVEEIFRVVDVPASPPGGYQKLYEFIARSLRYPAKARRTGIEGKVYVQFVVDKSGEITEVMVVKGIGGGCDEEAIRVMNLAPNWSPPMQEGKPVKQRIILPITFRLG